MKLKKNLIIAIMLLASTAIAQVPTGFSFQGVARNTDKTIKTGTLTIKVDVLASGAVMSEWTQTFTTTADAYGVFSVVVGKIDMPAGASANQVQGGVSDFTKLDWTHKQYQIMVSMLSNGQYVAIGNPTPLSSVPYAMVSQIAVTDHDTSATNELQNLTLTGTDLSLSKGNTVAFTGWDSNAGDDVTLSSTQTITGTKTFNGGLNAGGKEINNVANPKANQDAATKAYIDSVVASQIALVLANTTVVNPVGTILAFAGDTSKIPAGWLLCDGKELNITKYTKLFAAIGTNWGGNGVSTFAIPDLRGIFLRGAGENGTHSYKGEIVGTYQPEKTATNGLINSTSTVSGNTGNESASHTHTFVGGTTSAFINTSALIGTGNNFGAILQSNSMVTGAENSNHTHSFSGTVAAQTISGDSETKPASYSVNYIIKY